MTTPELPWATILTAVVSLGLGLLAFISATRAARSTARIEMTKVDAEAWIRAQAIYDGTIEQLRKDNERLTAKIDRLEKKIEQLEAAIRDQSVAIRDQGDAIRDRVEIARDQRDATANQRDAAANRRDVTASRREDVADQRARENEGDPGRSS